jgi:hypothetical protein
MRKLEKINRRRNAESFSDLFGNIYFGSDNLIVFIKLIIRLHRFHRSLAVKPPDHIVGKNDVYPGTSFSITISIKILILIFQISIQRLIPISNCRSLISLTLIRLGHTPFIFYIFD